MPSTTDYSFADVVLVRFPFTDQRGAKQRPAVVISSQAYNENRPDLILMALTSQLSKSPVFGEARIGDWKAAGLLKASAIKPVVFTAEKVIVRKFLGRLNEDDQQRLRDVIGRIISV